MGTLEGLKSYVDGEIEAIKIQINKLLEWHVKNSEILDKIIDTLIENEGK